MNLWTWAFRSRAGVATMAIGVLAAAGLATVVPAVMTHPASDQQPAGEVFVLPPDVAPVTTEAPAPIPEPVAAVTDAPTVATVTTPEPAAPAPVVDPESIGSVGENGYYTPAPPRVNPGEPPVGNIGSSDQFSGPAAPLPGEPGYDGPPVGQPIPRS